MSWEVLVSAINLSETHYPDSNYSDPLLSAVTTAATTGSHSVKLPEINVPILDIL